MSTLPACLWVVPPCRHQRHASGRPAPPSFFLSRRFLAIPACLLFPTKGKRPNAESLHADTKRLRVSRPHSGTLLRPPLCLAGARPLRHAAPRPPPSDSLSSRHAALGFVSRTPRVRSCRWPLHTVELPPGIPALDLPAGGSSSFEPQLRPLPRQVSRLPDFVHPFLCAGFLMGLICTRSILHVCFVVHTRR